MKTLAITAILAAMTVLGTSCAMANQETGTQWPVPPPVNVAQPTTQTPAPATEPTTKEPDITAEPDPQIPLPPGYDRCLEDAKKGGGYFLYTLKAHSTKLGWAIGCALEIPQNTAPPPQQ